MCFILCNNLLFKKKKIFLKWNSTLNLWNIITSYVSISDYSKVCLLWSSLKPHNLNLCSQEVLELRINWCQIELWGHRTGYRRSEKCLKSFRVGRKQTIVLDCFFFFLISPHNFSRMEFSKWANCFEICIPKIM